MRAPDPHERTMARLLIAARSSRPMRYRTKKAYSHAVPQRDRAYFERAWATLRRAGYLVQDTTCPNPPARFVAGQR